MKEKRYHVYDESGECVWANLSEEQFQKVWGQVLNYEGYEYGYEYEEVEYEDEIAMNSSY